MSWLDQVPRDLPSEFGIELDQFDVYASSNPAGEIVGPVNDFCNTMISLGYTVSHWVDYSTFRYHWRFKK